jgi:DNA-binding SARP family transcriptional activator
VEVRVLGNLELELDGGRVADLGGTKPRTLLGVLIAASGHPVLVPRLIDQVWDDDPPDRVEASLQTYVARLRKTLGGPTGVGARLLTHSGGYSLELEPHELDASRFTTGVENAVALVAAGDDAAADRALVDALALWRGEAYSGLPSRLLDAEAARLNELRIGAEVSLWDLRVRSGRHVEAVSALEQLVRLHPFSEPFWFLLALSLYRTGRQRDALAALRRARTILADELGIDPGRDLQQLELQVLQQDPTLVTDQRSSASLSTSTSTPARAEASESNAQRDLGGAVLVGRDEEMATALQALDQAIAGRGGLLVVTGQPGIGKSRIVSEVLDVATQRGVRVGRGTWDPDPGPPLAGWRSALNGALGADDALAPAADDGVRDAASEIYRLADALSAPLRDRPTVLAFDDVHWADPDSLRLIRRFIALVDELPVLVVIAARPVGLDASAPLAELFGALARAGAVRLELGGMPPGSVRDFVLTRSGVDIPIDLATELASRTGGNPFFLAELVRSLAAAGALSDRHADAWTTVPTAVLDVVRHRLADGPPDATSLLRVASVLGRSFEGAILRQPPLTELLSDVDDLEEAFESALVLGFLESDGPGRYRFVHALVRDAIYEALPVTTRERIHAHVAAALERRHAGHWDDHGAELAEHHRLAGPAYARPAWLFAHRTAASALARSSHEDALQWLSVAAELQVLDPLTTAEERESQDVMQAQALRMLGRQPEAWRPLAAAASSALDRGDAERAALTLLQANDGAVWGWRAVGEVDADAIALWRAIRQQLDGRPIITASVDLAIVAEQTYARRTEGDQDSIDSAISAARRSTSTRELIDVLFLASLALTGPDRILRRTAVHDELVELCAREGDERALTRALTERMATRSELGQFDELRSDLARALALAERHHAIQELYICRWADVWLAAVNGELDRANAAIDDNERLEQTVSGPGVGVSAGQRVFVAWLSGRPEEAEAGLAQLAGWVPLWFRDLHLLSVVATGRIDEVRGMIGPWSEQPPLLRDYMWTSLATARAQLWLQLGDPQALADLRRTLEPYADRFASFRLTALFGGQVSHTVGQLALVLGDEPAGRAHVEAARRAYVELGLHEWVQRADHTLVDPTVPLIGSFG